MKKILFTLIWILSFVDVFASLKDKMLPNDNTVWLDRDGVWVLSQILIYVKDFLFSILGIVAIWVFLYFWFQLVISRWNEEEFKKTLMWFVYAVIWLAIIPVAWWAVKIISTLKF